MTFQQQSPRRPSTWQHPEWVVKRKNDNLSDFFLRISQSVCVCTRSTHNAYLMFTQQDRCCMDIVNEKDAKRQSSLWIKDRPDEYLFPIFFVNWSKLPSISETRIMYIKKQQPRFCLTVMLFSVYWYAIYISLDTMIQERQENTFNSKIARVDSPLPSSMRERMV